MEPVWKKLTSRKFLGTLIVLVTVFLNAAGVTELETEELFALSASVSAFILGESALDRERIKATQLQNLANADVQLQKLVTEGNALISQKNQVIEDLTRLLDEAAGGEDPPEV